MSRPTPEQVRAIRAELWTLLCQHMDSYPNTDPYRALRAAFNKHARKYAHLEADDE